MDHDEGDQEALRKEAFLSAIPCCDYRDHETVCACPEHERSELHPFGALPTCLVADCDVTEDLTEIVVEANGDEERWPVCQPHAKEMIDEAYDLWGTPGIEIEVEFVRDGKVHRLGWDGEATYMPLDLPDDATDEQVFAAMAEAADLLGYGEEE